MVYFLFLKSFRREVFDSERNKNRVAWQEEFYAPGESVIGQRYPLQHEGSLRHQKL
ncbi:MAG: hypothetical protein F6J89_20215 [Symploca sp. SIO1C4]|uniref:Uncharacterized protein n=1 Tax=Symploca sp. SIO1C4 TaxID=2607765 RepID=A0A6B3NE65_9CYAN|nr:hypothetical protein [Symploca sp. SIO1C4]